MEVLQVSITYFVALDTCTCERGDKNSLFQVSMFLMELPVGTFLLFTTERASSFCDFWTTPGPSVVYSPKFQCLSPTGISCVIFSKFIISSAHQTVTPRGAINRSFYTRIGILLLLPFSSNSCLPRPAYHASSCNPAVRLRSSEPVSPPPRTAKVKKHLTPPPLAVLPARRFLADIPLAILSRSSHS